MVPIEVQERKITAEERQVLHNLLDRMCDEGQVSMMWEAYFRGEQPFTMVRKRMVLHMNISEIEQRDNGGIRQDIL